MSDTDAATAEAAAQAKSFRDSLESLRTRTDTSAKALATLGTAGLTAIGIEKVADVFPYPDGGWPFVALALVSFVAMIGVIVAFTRRLHNAGAALRTSSDPARMSDDPDEQQEISEVYTRTATLNGEESLSAYEGQAHALERQADAENDSATRQGLQQRAARIRAEIRATQASAAHKVVSDRLTAAVSDANARSLGVGFVVALLVFGVSVDWLDGQRTSGPAALKGCADARTAKVPADALPNFCDDAFEPPADTANAAQRAASRLSGLATLYATCIDTASKDNQPLAMCDSIKARLRTAAQ